MSEQCTFPSRPFLTADISFSQNGFSDGESFFHVVGNVNGQKWHHVRFGILRLSILVGLLHIYRVVVIAIVIGHFRRRPVANIGYDATERIGVERQPPRMIDQVEFAIIIIIDRVVVVTTIPVIFAVVRRTNLDQHWGLIFTRKIDFVIVVVVQETTRAFPVTPPPTRAFQPGPVVERTEMDPPAMRTTAIVVVVVGSPSEGGRGRRGGIFWRR